MSIYFLTEKEAKDFLKENVLGDVEVKETINKWVDDGIVVDSIVEKAETEYDTYLEEIRNLSKQSDVIGYLKKDKSLLELMYNAIQYQKEQYDILLEDKSK